MSVRNIMEFKAQVATFILFVALLPLAVAVPVLQGEPTNPETSPANTPVDKKANIDLHIIVSAEGKQTLPSESKIDLLGNEQACHDLQRLRHSIAPNGKATFVDLPACKIKLTIYITGFDTKSISVDLAHYKDPLRVLIKSNGPPVAQ
jgi:hypothetical protein